MDNIIQLKERELKSQLSTMVRETVEGTLNKLLDEEADRSTNAHRYERNEERLDTRAGHYKRKMLTSSGKVELKVPKLRTHVFLLRLGSEALHEYGQAIRSANWVTRRLWI